MNIPQYVALHKKRGQTPLQAIDAWRASNPTYASLAATYAGRLDPMAEGKLLVLLGEECKQREKYMGLDKEYVIEVVLDLSTDTGDTLGIASYENAETHPGKAVVLSALEKLSGSHTLPYPAFSSKTVNGKPLFMYSLEGTLNTITIPEHTETIYRSELLSMKEVPASALRQRISKDLGSVTRVANPAMELGRDFRQDEIRTQWETVFASMPERTCTILTLNVACATGTYMRTLAQRLANELGTTGCTLSINRTKIGTFQKIGPFGFWLKQY